MLQALRTHLIHTQLTALLTSSRPYLKAMATVADAPMSQPIDKLVKEDHDKVRYLFAEYRKAPTNEMKQQLAYLVVRELSMHSSKEEEVLYPAITKAFGSELRDHLLKEHTQLKEGLAKVSSTTIDQDPAKYDEYMYGVQAVFEHHIKDEEENEIPKLLKAPGVDALELGKQFEKAAAHAVTRPHVMAPDKPSTGNVITNRMTAPLDAAADAIRFAGNTPSVNP